MMKYNVLFDHSSDKNIGFLEMGISKKDAIQIIRHNALLAAKHYGDDATVTIVRSGDNMRLHVRGHSWCYSLAVAYCND